MIEREEGADGYDDSRKEKKNKGEETNQSTVAVNHL